MRNVWSTVWIKLNDSCELLGDRGGRTKVRRWLAGVSGGGLKRSRFINWNMDCRVIVAGCDPWVRGQIGEGFSHESEHDLALMVSDFLENGSSGTESWCSSDGDSCLSDLTQLAEKIPVSSSNTSLSLSFWAPTFYLFFWYLKDCPILFKFAIA